MIGRISGIYYNDTAAAPGFCVSVYVSGCDLHCKDCHNPEAQSFDYGEELTPELMDTIISSINKNGIVRKLCILGGEPLHYYNVPMTEYIIQEVRKVFPNLEIYIWTGYDYESLLKRNECEYILKNANYLIDGPYIEELRDTTLPMRGSSNQRIIKL